MEEAILKIDGIKKIYHDLSGEIEAIKEVTIDVFDGDFIAIVGPSGCGKSTLLSILANIENKSLGNIILKNKNSKLGYMLQKDSLFPWRTILDNCLLGLELSNTLNKSSKNNVIKLLKKYGLSEFMYKYPSALSGGMRQRVL